MNPSVSESGKPKWFVARTRYFRQEMKIRDWLTAHEIENYVPTETVRSSRSGDRGARHKMAEKPLAPNLVFLKAVKEDACALVTDYGLPMEFMVDCATHRMMVVPDKQMDDFQRVLDRSILEGGMVDRPLQLKDKVRVIKGPLQGVEGFVVEIRGRYHVAVSLCGFAWAVAQVPRAWIIKI